MTLQIKTSAWMFIASLLIKAKKLDTTPMSTRDEWINELYIITMECYTEIKIMKQSGWISKTWWTKEVIHKCVHAV